MTMMPFSSESSQPQSTCLKSPMPAAIPVDKMSPDELATILDKLLRTDHLKWSKSIKEHEGLEEVTKEINLVTTEDYKISSNSKVEVLPVIICPLHFIVNALDQLFFDFVCSWSEGSSNTLKKLLSLYRSAGPSPSDVITWNLRKFSLSYLALALTVPELFENENSVISNYNNLSFDKFDELIEILMTRNPNVYATFFADLSETIMADREAFDGVFGGFCGGVIKRILGEGKRGEERLTLMTLEIPNVISGILGPMSQVPLLAEFLVERSGLFADVISGGPEDACNKSILGAVWRATAVDAPENFDAMQALLPKDYGPPLPQTALLAAFQSLRDALDLIAGSLHENVLMPLIRSSPERRNVILKHFAAVAKVNANRAKLQADVKTINTDGFVMGAFGSLLRLCDPFTLAVDPARSNKIDLIDTNFIYHNDLMDWSEVGRCGMDPKEFEEQVKFSINNNKNNSGNNNNSNASPNFISQVFYLTLQFFKLGPLRLIQEYGNASREFNEIEQELKRLEESRGTWSSLPNAPMISRFIDRIKGRMRELVDVRISQDFHLMHPLMKKSTFALITFTLAFYRSLKGDSLKRALPEFFMESVWEYLLFMCRIDGELSGVMGGAEQDAVLALAAELLPSSELIKNPYIRAKQVEIFFAIVMTDEERRTSVFVSLDRRVHRLLVLNMVKFYVQVESLGTSTAFYDKFSIRYHLTKVLMKILSFDVRAFDETQQAESLDDATFVRFINLCVSDATYLLDESLSKLGEIREKQVQSQTQALSAEDQKSLAQIERQCQSLLALGSESLAFLGRLTAAIPDAFLRPEILDRLTAMLNFNLVLLAGPRCSKLKVTNPSKYNFNPRALLAALIEIYLSLGGRDEFLRSVAADERSFSPQLFESCVGIMKRTGMSSETIEAFTTLSHSITSGGGGRGDGGDTFIDADSVPEEFLDPILFNVMVDPVLLPASHMIVDRATIHAHLLNDPHDPFNRQPLSIDQVVAVPELKARIDEFIREAKH